MSEQPQGPTGLIIEPTRGLSAVTEVDYVDLLSRYFLRRWYLYVLFVGAAVAAMFFYLKTKQHEYAVTARIVITERDDTGPTDDPLRRSTQVFSAAQNVYNEIERITSYELMSSVVDELDLQYGYWTQAGLERKDGYRDFPVLIDSFLPLNAGPVDLSFRLEPKDYESFRLYTDDKLVGNYPFDSLITTKFGVFRFALNGALPQSSETTLHVSISDTRAVANAYLSRLEANFTGINSTTVLLRIQDAVPARGVDILTELMTNYNEMKMAEADKAAQHTLGFIDERLTEANQKLQRIEANLERYKLNNEITDESTSDLNLVLQNVDQYGREKENLTLQLNILRSLERVLDVRGDEPQLISIDNSVLITGQIPDQVQLYNRLVLERKELLVSGQTDNPAVISISQRIASLRGAIESSVTNLRQSLVERQSLIQSQYDRSLGQLRSVPTKQREVQDRSREQKIVENLYVYLLQKKEETALAYVNNVTTAEIIDAAHAGSDPVSPNKKLFMFLALVLGGAIPFLYSVAREEIFNYKVGAVRDVKRVFSRRPVLGQISKHRGKDRMAVAGSSRSEISDQFRSLRNNLLFHFPAADNVFLLTSAGKGEGKSFVAANLAVSFAHARKRVVIVDFDFYNAQVANYLGQPNGTGLSNFLGGQASVGEVVHSAGEDLGVHYVPAGDYFENPGDLISNDRGLAAFFAHLHERFDVIIVDAPPIGILSDAVLLHRYITASLYVIRVGVSTKASLKQGRETIEADRLMNPVLVLNSVTSGQQDYYT
ncbi:GumC family protein [Neolewinella antarctica]|uniref:Capsular exopolysaccharide synthesis family protein n=1 Tax=Neolewinella antarctica TaxID=442734 RepID=A0ABX0X9I0_9BACT|nr:polysaccharide biosynthesis tyrosine autokinase [Neolewinella antarctica]NJC25887.1 capsular exopolysaccharide synthesis family protein [Neolewinella antarctica]